MNIIRPQEIFLKRAVKTENSFSDITDETEIENAIYTEEKLENLKKHKVDFENVVQDAIFMMQD